MPHFTIHQNPGLIDLAAFTTFGVNSKPATASPIGYFGTGLKYAIAVLARHKCPVTLWRGDEPHIFEAREMSFREKEFLQLYMRRQRGATSRWMATALPFTTELGKNWELWMAYRELHSNALDEGGETFEDIGATASGHPLATRIVVEGEAYHQIHRAASTIFLKTDVAPPEPGLSNRVRMLAEPSRHFFYRGLRVADSRLPCIMTWDIHNTLTLTEDRTIANYYMVEYYVAGFVMQSKDRSLIERVLRAPDDTFEASITWDSWKDSFPPTQEFISCARIYARRGAATIIIRDADRAQARSTDLRSDWRKDLAQALRGTDQALASRYMWEHKAELATILERAIERDKQTEIF